MEQLSRQNRQILPPVPCDPHEYELLVQSEQNGVKRVEHGREAISIDESLIIHRFRQRRALLLINLANGSALLKSAGPRPVEIFSHTAGQTDFPEAVFDSQYELFMQHAAKTDREVVLLSFAGDQSCLGQHLIRQALNDGARRSINVMEMPEIKVPSGAEFIWDIAYVPASQEVVTRRFDPEEVPIYEKYAIPDIKIHESRFALQVALDDEKLLRTSRRVHTT